MAKIKIACDRGVGFRDYTHTTVYLDQLAIGIIHPGESREFEIDKGKHRLEVKMGIYSSKKVDFILNSDFKSFIVENDFSSLFLIIALSLIVIVPWIAISGTENLSFYPLIISILGVIACLYYFLFRRTSFLKIKEIKPYR